MSTCFKCPSKSEHTKLAPKLPHPHVSLSLPTTAGDRGGVADLINTIKTTKIPIITICNDKYCQKLKSLKNHVLELDFSKPTAAQISKRILPLALSEGLTLNQVRSRVPQGVTGLLLVCQQFHVSISIDRSDQASTHFNVQRSLMGRWTCCREGRGVRWGGVGIQVQVTGGPFGQSNPLQKSHGGQHKLPCNECTHRTRGVSSCTGGFECQHCLACAVSQSAPFVRPCSSPTSLDTGTTHLQSTCGGSVPQQPSGMNVDGLGPEFTYCPGISCTHACTLEALGISSNANVDRPPWKHTRPGQQLRRHPLSAVTAGSKKLHNAIGSAVLAMSTPLPL